MRKQGSRSTSSGDVYPILIALQSARPNVLLTPTRIDFGNQPIGMASSSQPVTLTNTGEAPLTITNIGFTGANAGDFSQTNTCGTSVAPGASCTISIIFTPTMAGARSASLSVSDNAPGSPQTVTLTGTGTVSAVSLSATTLTFPNQVVGITSQGQNVVLTNTGTAMLSIASITVSGDFTQQNTCGASLPPGAKCSITVQFTPKQKGTRTGSVTIADNAPDSPQTISLTGVGTVVKLSAIGLNFGSEKVGRHSAPAVVTVTNISPQSLTIGSIGIAGADSGDFMQTNTCGSSLPAHGSCSIRVVFTPTAAGPRSATIAITDNGGGSPQMVTLSGTGT